MNRKAVLGLVAIVIVALVAWRFLARTDEASNAITASGTIEATEVNVASEVGGRVVAVEVAEGDDVNANDIVVRFDSALIDAQRSSAAAAIAVAGQGGAAAVAAAAAAARVLDVQAAKLTVRAPITGVVFARTIEPGEVAGPGTTLLVVGRTDDLFLTVYVPEDRYGRIELGMSAEVVVDAFGSQVFDATVTHIDETAQFTPRNVQTAASRRGTVYGIRLRVDNKRDRLKPGMPADVTFDR